MVFHESFWCSSRYFPRSFFSLVPRGISSCFFQEFSVNFPVEFLPGYFLKNLTEFLLENTRVASGMSSKIFRVYLGLPPKFFSGSLLKLHLRFLQELLLVLVMQFFRRFLPEGFPGFSSLLGFFLEIFSGLRPASFL